MAGPIIDLATGLPISKAKARRFAEQRQRERARTATSSSREAPRPPPSRKHSPHRKPPQQSDRVLEELRGGKHLLPAVGAQNTR